MQIVLSYLTLFRLERRAGDLLFAIAFVVFSVCVAASLPSQAQFLGNKTLVAEPGFWPLVGVLMMVGFGIVHLLGTYNAPRLPGRLKEALFWLRSLEYVGWFISYVLIVPIIGYLPATIVLTLLLTLRLGYRSAGILCCAVLFGVTVVLVFKTGLGVRLPAGQIYQYLPDSIRSFVMVNF